MTQSIQGQIFVVETSNSFSNNTLRKRKQKRQIQTKNIRIKRLNKKIKTLHSKGNEKDIKHTLEAALENLPEHLASFIKLQVKLNTKRSIEGGTHKN